MQPEIDKWILETIKTPEPNAAAGDADAQHHLFVLLHAQAMEEYDHALFNQAESYLLESAKNGFPDAVESLKNHEARRYGFELRVKRRAET